MNRRTLALAAATLAAAALAAALLPPRPAPNGKEGPACADTGTCPTQRQAPSPTLRYGIAVDSLAEERGTVRRGQTFSRLMAQLGVEQETAAQLTAAARGQMDLRDMRAGNRYVVYRDSSGAARHFVYLHDATRYVRFSFPQGGTASVEACQVPVATRRRAAAGVVESNLWNALTDAGAPPALAMELAEIYAWSIDFFGLQRGDSFSVIYDQQYADTTPLGPGRVRAARFDHQGRGLYALEFAHDSLQGYYDEQGENLQKAFLRAPLRYSRISSRFSHSRKHPVLRIRRPHYGVDYAAPSGTPVYSVGDGTVVERTHSRQGGNTLKIKHNGVYTTGYLHLRGFAKGIKRGAQVKQGQLIGYVGSTGLSTGPHLDFRFWRNGKPVDPLKVESPGGAPVPDAHRPRFDSLVAATLPQLARAADSLRARGHQSPASADPDSIAAAAAQ